MARDHHIIKKRISFEPPWALKIGLCVVLLGVAVNAIVCNT
jgi:hypothetical protein